MYEEYLQKTLSVLIGLTEIGAVIVIFAGFAVGFWRFVWNALTGHIADNFITIRLDFGRFLALGLEFQLAADLLSTVVAPTFEEIGKLAAIAAIRTALNFFLSHEISVERELVMQGKKPAPE